MKRLWWIAPAILILVFAFIVVRISQRAKFTVPSYPPEISVTPATAMPVGEEEGIIEPTPPVARTHSEALVSLDVGTSMPEGVSREPEQLTSPITTVQYKGIIKGKVTDQNAKPISEAKVIGIGRKAEASIVTNKAQTDSAGQYVLNYLPPAAYEISAQHPEYAIVVKNNIILQDAQTLEGIDFVLSPGITIKGKVVDEKKAPVDEVSIDLYKRLLHLNPQGGSIFTTNFLYSQAQTNEEGTFELSRVSSGEYRLECKKQGYPREWLELAIEEAQPLEELVIVLRAAGTIAGRVVDSENKPVTGATIQPKFYLGQTGKLMELQDVKSGTTDEKGNFILQELKPIGHYDVLVSAAGYTPQMFFALRVNTGANELRLSTGGALSGRITFFESNEPAGSIKVKLENQDEKQVHFQSAVSNSLGYYYFAGIPTGKFKVYVASEKYTAEPRLAVAVEGGKETSGIDFKIYQGLVIRGKVVDAVTAMTIGEANVKAQARIGSTFFMSKNMTTVSDSSGSFELTGLHQGVYYLRAQAEGYFEIKDHRQQTRVLLSPGDAPKEVTLKLYSGGWVSGQVINKQGGPVGAAIVALYHPPDALHRIDTKKLKTVTDQEGHFKIADIDVSQARQFLAGVFAPGYAPGKSKPILLTPRTPYAAVKIIVGKGQTVRGKVIDDKKNPLSYVTIKLTHQDFSGAGELGERQTFTDGQGMFAFYDIPPGTIVLQATREQFVPAQLSLTIVEGEDVTDVELVLSQARSISGTVQDDLSQPVANADVAAWPQEGAQGSGSAKTDHGGHYLISKLGSGQFGVSVSFGRQTPTGNHRYSLTREGIPSGTEGADFIFPVNAALRGQVFDEVTFVPVERFTVSGSTEVQAPYEAKGGFSFGTKQFSSSSGEFEIQGLPTGTYNINITADGYITEPVNNIAVVSPTTTDVGSIMLKLGGGIKARILSELTEEPISGVTGDLENGPSARTNHDGFLNFRSLKPGTYKLTLTHGHYMQKEVADIIVEQDKVTDIGTFYLEPGGSIEGEVADVEDNPLDNVTVKAENQDFEKQVNTGIDGYYFLDGVKKGTTRISATANVQGREVYVSKYINVNPDEVHRVDFVIDVNHSLQGLIYPGNFSLENIKVAAYPIDDTNAIHEGERIAAQMAGNRYIINNLVGGYYMLIAEATVINRPADSKQPGIKQFYKINVYAPEEHQNIEFQNASLSGRVLDKNTQQPCKGVNISLSYLPPVYFAGGALSSIFTFSTKSINKGFYRVYGLPAGRYKLLVRVEGQPEIHYDTIDLSSNQQRENYTIYVSD